METCINYCEPGFAYISSDERRWITKVIALANDHPDECIIIKHPQDNDGFIYAKFPQKWARIAPPRHMSDEQKAIAGERLRRFRAARTANS